MKGEFSLNTKRILAKRAGEMCSICKSVTGKPHTDEEKAINLGEAAHIKGLKNKIHLRYDATMTDEMRSHISNAIWLCSTCHKEIDSDSTRYTVEVLNKFKLDHEQSVLNNSFDISHFPEYIKLEAELSLLKEKFNQEENSILKKKILQLEQDKSNFKETLYKTLELLGNNESSDLSSFEDIKHILLLENNIDKAIHTIDNSISKEEKTVSDLRLIKANLLYSKKDIIEADKYFRQSIDIYSNVKNNFNYANFLSKQNKLEASLNYYKSALKIGKEKLDSGSYNFQEYLSLIMIISHIGIIYLNYGLLDEASKYLFFVFPAFERLYNQNKEIFTNEYLNALNHISIYYKEVGDSKKAKEYLDIQSSILQGSFLQNPKKYFLNYSTNLYNSTNLISDPSSSIKELIGIEQIVIKYKNNSNEYEANKLLSNIYFSIASNQEKVNNYNKASEYYEKSIITLDYFNKVTSEEHLPLLIKVYCNFGLLLGKTSPIEASQKLLYAKELCSNALERNNDLNYAILLGQIYHNLATQSIAVNLKDALSYANEAVKIRKKAANRIPLTQDFDFGLSTLLKGEILLLSKKPFIRTIKQAKNIFINVKDPNTQIYIERCNTLLTKAG